MKYFFPLYQNIHLNILKTQIKIFVKKKSENQSHSGCFGERTHFLVATNSSQGTSFLFQPAISISFELFLPRQELSMLWCIIISPFKRILYTHQGRQTLARFPNCHELPEASGMGNLTRQTPVCPAKVNELLQFTVTATLLPLLPSFSATCCKFSG